MKRTIYLSLASVAVLQGAEKLKDINVTERIGTEVVADVYGEELKSSDLAEALSQSTPSMTMIRRSGIANDIVFRGQKRDNINVIVDGMKVCGACPNRMDPPTSHVMTQNIDEVQITHGAFDVEDFGTLSGKIKINTRKPQEEFAGEVTINVGSYDYKKATVSASGGIGSIKVLVSASKEEGGQYKDGDGNNFAEQLANQVDGTPLAGMAYLPNQSDRDAYERKSAMAKLFWDITDDQELRLGYTANRSDNVLYPSTPMDADYDDSDLYNIEYRIDNIGDISKKLEMQVYQTEVDHPMSIRYRKSSVANGVITHALTTKMQGAKMKNSFDIDEHELVAGLDYSLRNWDGAYYKNEKPFPADKFRSIYDVNTKNQALFIKDKFTLGSATIESGLRYDDSTVTPTGIQQSNDYSGVTGNIFATIKANRTLKYYMGIGKSTRVPDPRELYYKDKMGVEIGTPNLNETTNYEADLGFEKDFANSTLKTKFFYSKLQDYIYYNGMKTGGNNFTNIDATLYGAELSGSYLANDAITLDYGLAYTVGKKDDLPQGQTDKDLVDITPMKMTLGATYMFDTAVAKLELVARDDWNRIDSDNGEQEIDGYTVVNFKWDKEMTEALNITLGMDNIFDKTYTVSNSQKDLTLVGGDKSMLMNEPGRYMYLNGTYRF
ncbi:TonB-dependent receptor [Sulfurovum sp. bin170]|uniref:TonB-dependent receptor n=1 Tax=Sulfurovum sp. bin170 TaxID=2695268 RepID=UPI0013E01B00|nr:TonB-dependent receptor [Sulfurovum sp. bin170]NEW59735.1 TonB-dependent receptor [Sulfurovum sp. bin170]